MRIASLNCSEDNTACAEGCNDRAKTTFNLRPEGQLKSEALALNAHGQLASVICTHVLHTKDNAEALENIMHCV